MNHGVTLILFRNGLQHFCYSERFLVYISLNTLTSCNLFPWYISIRPTSFFCSHVQLQNGFNSFVWGYCYVLVHSQPSCWFNFLALFQKVLFCLYCFTIYQYILIRHLLLVSFDSYLKVALSNLPAVLILSFPLNIRGSFYKLPDIFRMGTFIESTHMKL